VLIKSADDKSKRLALYEDLQNSPLLDTLQKERLANELKRLRQGIQGEKDSAYYLDNYFKKGVNHAVIHDLRVDIAGEVAQIDHLIINRMFDIYMLETKNFSGDVSITPHGEFSVKYGSDRVYNIPSPIEQSKRHENVLRRLLDKVQISGRAGTSPQFKHVVLVDPKAAINRPDSRAFNSSMVIRADQFRPWQVKHIDKDLSIPSLIFGLLNFRTAKTLKEIAEKIARQHRPENLLALPDWLAPKATTTQIAMPGLVPPPIASTFPQTVNTDETSRKRLICITCKTKITYDEGKFCWNNEKRFKGHQYCRQHQANFR
jgi:Nuclease-related domain